MKLEHKLTIPKTDIDDYTRGEQKLMGLMAAVRGAYDTDYIGMEKAITVRMNCVVAPKVDAMAELSGLSKNLIINDLIELGLRVLEENLSEEDYKLYSATESKKMQEWMTPYLEDK